MLQRLPLIHYTIKYRVFEKPVAWQLHGVLGTRTSTSRMSGVGVAGEFDGLRLRDLKSRLELLANGDDNVLALVGRATLTIVDVRILARGDLFSNSASPDTDAIELATDVDDDAHDLAVFFFLQGLANGSQHDTEPEVIDGDALALLGGVGPLAAMLVLRVLPFWTDALLEEMVVGLDWELAGRSDVVLEW